MTSQIGPVYTQGTIGVVLFLAGLTGIVIMGVMIHHHSVTVASPTVSKSPDVSPPENTMAGTIFDTACLLQQQGNKDKRVTPEQLDLVAAFIKQLRTPA